MKILFIRNAYIKESFYVSCEIQLVKSLNKFGDHAKLIGIDNRNKFEDEIIYLKSPFHKRFLFLLKLSLLLPVYCIKNKINAVILDERIIPSTFFLLLLKKIFSINVILDIRSVPVESELPWDYKFNCLIANKLFDGATFITQGTKEYIENLIKRKFKNSTIFSSAVNLSIFSPSINNNLSVNIKNKVEGKFVFFYHGSISPNRGINLILDAINRIKSEISSIIFISISDNNKYIKDYCESKNYSLDENLLLLNTVKYEEIPGYINLADICIVPLPRIFWWEISSPLKLMEYLAMAKPIVLSNIRAHTDVIPENSDYALFFDPDNNDDLYYKIKEAISNIDKLKANSIKGRNIVEKKYSWDIQANIIKDFINNL